MPREHDLNLDDDQSWREYRRLVTAGISNLENDIKELTKKVDDMHLKFTVDITTLKVKAGIWGALMGSVVSFATALIVESIRK